MNRTPRFAMVFPRQRGLLRSLHWIVVCVAHEDVWKMDCRTERAAEMERRRHDKFLHGVFDD